MKNFLFFLGCLAIISSCKKEITHAPTTISPASLEGDWKISKYSLTGKFNAFSSFVNSSGTVERNIEINNNIIYATYSDSIYPVGVYPLANKPSLQYQTIVDTGVVNTNTISFSKDGSWSRTFSYTITRTQFLWVTHNFNSTFESNKYVYNNKYTNQSSGKWEITKKDNNEIVSLTKLVETYKSDSYSSNMSFVDGTKVQEWKIVGLKNKNLEFEVLGYYNELFDMDSTTFFQESGTYVQ